jgi:outer membrane protein assembly factor BamD (BamD/ComL family)
MQDQTITEKDAQFRALQLETETLKKRDGLVFAEIRALQQQGQTGPALSRYQDFLKAYPTSPLAAYAASAVTELTAEVNTASANEARRRADLIDPNRDRELVRRFNDGFATPEELAPLLKKKSRAKVLTLLGQPNQTFNDGSELGYADKALSSATGKRGMLIVSFESGTFSSVRLDYAGRKVVP